MLTGNCFTRVFRCFTVAALFLAAFGAAAGELPAAVRFERHSLELERAMADNNPAAAIRIYEEKLSPLRKEVKFPAELDYDFAIFLHKAGRLEKAAAALDAYLANPALDRDKLRTALKLQVALEEDLEKAGIERSGMRPAPGGELPLTARLDRYNLMLGMAIADDKPAAAVRIYEDKLLPLRGVARFPAEIDYNYAVSLHKAGQLKKAEAALNFYLTNPALNKNNLREAVSLQLAVESDLEKAGAQKGKANSGLARELPLSVRLGHYNLELEWALAANDPAEAVRIYEEKLLPLRGKVDLPAEFDYQRAVFLYKAGQLEKAGAALDAYLANLTLDQDKLRAALKLQLALEDELEKAGVEKSGTKPALAGELPLAVRLERYNLMLGMAIADNNQAAAARIYGEMLPLRGEVELPADLGYQYAVSLYRAGRLEPAGAALEAYLANPDLDSGKLREGLKLQITLEDELEKAGLGTGGENPALAGELTLAARLERCGLALGLALADNNQTAAARIYEKKLSSLRGLVEIPAELDYNYARFLHQAGRLEKAAAALHAYLANPALGRDARANA